jgi:hypothetical protein
MIYRSAELLVMNIYNKAFTHGVIFTIGAVVGLIWFKLEIFDGQFTDVLKSAFSFLIKVIIAFFAGWLTYWFGLKKYYKEKEHEMLQQRYLKEGVDNYAKQVEKSLNIFMDNWKLSILLLKMYREFGNQVELSYFEKKYQGVKLENIAIITNQKYATLVGGTGQYQYIQLLASFVGEATNFMRSDLYSTIKLQVISNRPVNKEIIDVGIKKLKELEIESHKYYSLLNESQKIAEELERGKVSLKDVINFHKRKTVIESVQRLEKIFKEELKKHKEQ